MTFLSTLFVLSAIDLLYINLFSSEWMNIIRDVQKTNVKLKYLSMYFTYLLLSLGLYYFVIQKNESPFHAFLLGCFTYGIFELTSYTMFSNWPLYMVFLDTLWGGVLFATVTKVLQR